MALRTIEFHSFGGLYLQRQGHSNPKPYTAKTDYYYSYAFGRRNGSPFPPNYAKAEILSNPTVMTRVAKAYAQAYDRLAGQVTSDLTVNLGETVGEGREAFQMIAKRVGQLTSAYGNMKKGNVFSALHDLGWRRTRRKDTWIRVGNGGKKRFTLKSEKIRITEAELKRRVKMPATAWLEYRLGWDPVITEIATSLNKVHEHHVTSLRKTVEGRGKYQHVAEESYTYYSGGERYLYTSSTKTMYQVKLVCDIRAVNSTKKKYEEYGIVNPALIAWNLTPGSMFIDWFLPVGKFLNGFTVFYGITLGDLMRTEKRTTNVSISNLKLSGTPSDTVISEEGRYFERTVGSGPVSLQVPGMFDRQSTGLQSAARAATAVSVLINMLR